MTIKENALAFFDACETGKGWTVCKQWCHDDASFSAQADALGEVKSLQAYADWMTDIVQVMPDARYEMLAFGVDEERDAISAAAVFHATHTGEGGPVPPTGKSVVSDYCYYIKFNGGKISHMTKIWNDGHALRQAGWA
ncbi:ester cyclase [Aurantiacibacter marinus]|uniref:Polyketide cyclase n=1 Tax=Aurantiacibacter marinus TaxID=874156 RepID=A0A0H0XN02_9SPHN|nr:nuclear transport factor 2 family protein [Aurantiacibacter marinus]KLI63376.1 polyketide cyclase [Aurantiacibacter marinus]